MGTTGKITSGRPSEVKSADPVAKAEKEVRSKLREFYCKLPDGRDAAKRGALEKEVDEIFGDLPAVRELVRREGKGKGEGELKEKFGQELYAAYVERANSIKETNKVRGSNRIIARLALFFNNAVLEGMGGAILAFSAALGTTVAALDSIVYGTTFLHALQKSFIGTGLWEVCAIFGSVYLVGAVVSRIIAGKHGFERPALPRPLALGMALTGVSVVAALISNQIANTLLNTLWMGTDALGSWSAGGMIMIGSIYGMVRGLSALFRTERATDKLFKAADDVSRELKAAIGKLAALLPISGESKAVEISGAEGAPREREIPLEESSAPGSARVDADELDIPAFLRKYTDDEDKDKKEKPLASGTVETSHEKTDEKVEKPEKNAGKIFEKGTEVIAEARGKISVLELALGLMAKESKENRRRKIAQATEGLTGSKLNKALEKYNDIDKRVKEADFAVQAPIIVENCKSGIEGIERAIDADKSKMSAGMTADIIQDLRDTEALCDSLKEAMTVRNAELLKLASDIVVAYS
ncbi:Uncharacterised protein [Candidatus Burarchaeum australiense]|nr:Uncharacterised protein [Candidatus Burarchaeum australiense]